MKFKWTTVRKISQGFFLLLFIYVLWSTTYPLKGVVSPEILFKIDPLIIFIISLSERILIPGIAFSVIMILMTIVFGRFFCGWICPMGTLIDLTSKSADFKKNISDASNKKINSVKYFILALIVIFAILGIQIAWVMDPIVIAARFVSLNLIPSITLLLDETMIYIIKNFELYGGFYDFYRTLKSNMLGVNAYYFSNSIIIFSFFLAILVSSVFISRFWCRVLCPLGALYGLFAKFAFLERVVGKCTKCRVCRSNCRMGAINEDMGYNKAECILCMDCVYDCRQQATKFVWRKKSNTKSVAKNGINRRNFLILLSLSLLGFRNRRRNRKGRNRNGVIRPPGSIVEDKFLDSCIRCGNCMKVCITNGLQPVMFESGLEGIWTPQLVPEIGYCEYGCTLCGDVCPTGAILKLAVNIKKNTKIGTARIDRSICIAWRDKAQCAVCEEHCPIPTKAIKLIEEKVNGIRIYKPYVVNHLCIGCGICQNKCPAEPTRAIRVHATNRDRTKA